ncbi:MAG: hypothetical protein R3C26_09040 [Calditrichia bacterium]
MIPFQRCDHQLFQRTDLRSRTKLIDDNIIEMMVSSSATMPGTMYCAVQIEVIPHSLLHGNGMRTVALGGGELVFAAIRHRWNLR